jgi:hypothetical protein
VRRRWTDVGLLVIVGAAGAVAAVHWSAGPWFGAAVAAYVVGHALSFPNPSGRSSTLVPCVAAVIALGSNGSAVMTLAGAAVALPFGVLVVHLRFGRRTLDRVFPADAVGLAVFGTVFCGGIALSGMSAETDPAGLLLLLAAGLAWFGTTAIVQVASSKQGRSLPRRLLLTRALGDWPAYAALMSSAALFEFTDEAVGIGWALVLAGLPCAFSHMSLHRVQTTRRTYRQTIDALGRIPEAGGMIGLGTARRVADLCVATAAESGLIGRALDRVEYAALLRDIGRVVLANPAVAAGEYSSSDVARWSAAIIGEARYLEPVAQMISAETEPYRKVGQARDPGVPVGAKIVRVVAAYDAGLQSGLDALGAVEVLHRGAAYEFDPEVVGALRRVLERQGLLAA